MPHGPKALALKRKQQQGTSRLEQMSQLSIYDDPNTIRMTSIICTIGPKTQTVEALTELRKAGMNIVRMNFSHGSYEFHGATIANTRKSQELYPELGRAVGIALDTKGPEIRTGLMKGGANAEVLMEKDKEVVLTTDDSRYNDGDENTLYVDYKNLPTVVKVGSRVFIDDGLLSLEVLEVQPTSVRCKILNTTKISSRKGVNLPDANVDLPAVSEKDAADLKWGVEQGIDIVFASFIRNAQNVKDVRAVLGEKGKRIKIISKIENHEGMRNFDEILAESDGIMVARGDLGIEIPPEKVFVAQKMMIAKCNIAGKSVICATQMLESMTTNPRPTRAETSDVANAVLDGADCVMLSGETAKGIYPIEAVKMMHLICLEAEGTIHYGPHFNDLRSLLPKPLTTPETVASSAVNAAIEQFAAAIIVLSTSGDTARLVAKYRPPCPIITVTRNARTTRTIHLYRGCFPLLFQVPEAGATNKERWQDDVDERIQFALDEGKKLGFLEAGDTVIAIQGWRGGAGFTNTMRLLSV